MSRSSVGEQEMSNRAKRFTGARFVGSMMVASVMLCVAVGCTSTESQSTQSPAETPAATDSTVPADTVQATDNESEAVGSPAPEVSIPAAATTPVPPPQPGDINQTVAAVPVTTLPAAAVAETAEVGSGVLVEVVDVKPVTGTGRGPGEVGGPAAAVTVKITNSSPAVVALSQLEVTAQDSAGTPAGPLSGDPAAPMSGELAAGASGSGVYVFSLGASHQNPLMLSISYAAGAPVALYTADVSN